MGQIKLPYGLREDKLVHISEVVSGLKCDCICPACKCRLVAKIGSGERNSHFSHHSSCEYAFESMLHILAKEIIEEAKEIRLPAYGLEHDGKWCLLSSGRSVKVDRVRLERRMGGFVPDVVVNMNGRELLVEIAVTHFVDEEKLQKINNLGLSAIEIDLSSLRGEEFTRREVKEAVINTWGNRTWLYSARREKLLQVYLIKQQKIEMEQAKEQGKREVFCQKNLKEIVFLGDKSREHAKDCPLKINDSGAEGYASIHECMDCEFYRGERDCMSTIVCLGEYYLNKRKKNKKGAILSGKENLESF